MTEIWNLSALCRCCHSDGHFKSLDRPYVVKNDVEIYSSMLRDTFGIIINPPKGDISYAICDTCIVDLRNATTFKKQVLICNSKFEEYCKNEESQQISDIKIELESIHGDTDLEAFDNSCNDGKEEKIFMEVKVENILDIKEAKEINGDLKTVKVENDKKFKPSIKQKKSKPPKQKTSKNSTSENPVRCTYVSKLSEFVVKSENGTFSCKMCEKDYKSYSAIRAHVISVHIDSYKCETCDLEFKNKKKYSSHMSTHRLEKFTCTYCGKIFSSTYMYNLHLITHTKEAKFECDYCSKKFCHKRSLENHIMVVHLGLSRPKVMCDVCGHNFNDVTNMRKHVQAVHEKLRPFKCSLCPRDFTAKKHLVIHERRWHTGERPYKCDLCDSAYPCSQELRKHMLIHNGLTRSYFCKLCRAEFSSRSGLAKHLRTHVGSKPLVCPICGKDFSCKYSLRRHVRHHTGEKRFQCGICLKKFPEKASLRRHHDRFHSGKVVEKKQCHLCKRSVTDLEKHITVHSNKPHICEYCSKRYSFRNALNRHIANIHFGRKAHACDLCDHKYVQMKSLVNHKLKVHKIDMKLEKEEEER